MLNSSSIGAAPRPHIVYVLSDNLGWGDVGFLRQRNGGATPEVATPHLDALAAGGVTLDRFYTYEMCSPSRSSLLSGRLPIHVNFHNDHSTIPGSGIPLGMTTMAGKMKAAGYATHQLGKWHVGFATPGHTPMGRGFDTSFGYIAGAYNGYMHGWSGNACPQPQYNRNVSYPYDNRTEWNLTYPLGPAGVRCTAESIAWRHLSPTVDLWEAKDGVEGPAYAANATGDMGGTGWEEELFVRRAESLIAAHGGAASGADADAPRA